MARFSLQFPLADIRKYAGRYAYTEDQDALTAGALIAGGQTTLENLRRIFEWKTNGRGRSRLEKNSVSEVSEALSLSAKCKTDRIAIATLCGLSGVGLPVASAILTAINPKRFTIIDFRALEALGMPNASYTLDFYLRYLAYCRDLSKKTGVDLRTLDRALWQWSKENGR